MTQDSQASDAPTVVRDDGAPVSEPVELSVGARLSRYVVVEIIGRGGIAQVCRAYDPKLRREVALKLLRLRSGDDGADAEVRLAREAQAMAQLSHPNVVPVFDVEAQGGLVFIAMEYVEGEDLRAWIARGPHPWREVLSKFVAAGRGLAAAHRAGIIHRDFKPHNVLLGHDARVRVTDFGLARAAGEAAMTPPASTMQALEDSMETSALTQDLTRDGTVMGTPAYMAAEQHDGKTPDVASDQFSFCVALWEGLYGQRPFRGRTTEALGQAKRHGEIESPPSASKVPGWLHQVVLRGLHRDPRKRWPSMDALLAALARDPTRRRWALAAGAVIPALLGAALGGRAIIQARTTASCEAKGGAIEDLWNADVREQVAAALRGTGVANAEATAQKTMPWLDAYAREWQSARADVCMAAHVRSDLSQALLEKALWCLDERWMDFGALVAELRRGEAGVVVRAVNAAANLPRMERCLDEDALADLPTPPARQRDQVRTIKAELSRAGALLQAARHAEGIAVARSALAEADAVEWPPLRVAARICLAELLEGTGDYPEAERHLTDAYVEGIRSDDAEAMAGAAVMQIALVGDRLARHDDGRLWGQLAEPHVRRIEPVEGTSTSTLLHNLAVIDEITGQYDEAKAGYERALAIRETVLGPEHPRVATTLANLANVISDQGAFEEARVLYERAAEIRKEAMGSEHPDYASTLNNLAILRDDQGASAEALELYRRALAIWEKALGPEHPRVAVVVGNMGGTHLKLGEHDEARRALERALSILEATLGPEHPFYAAFLESLTQVLLAQGDTEDAVRSARQALAIHEKVGSSAQALSNSRFVLAQALWATNERELARAQAREAVAAFPKDGNAKELEWIEQWLEEHAGD
jgi:tetratricopeptide (TPR) repeat protein/tRNA A-37 threonylcarbamoyl transferase component Bud32